MNWEYFLRSAEKIGPCTREYMDGVLKARPYKEQAYDACRGILRFSEKSGIGPQRLELACKRALRTEKFSYKIIDNILANNQDKLELEASSSQQDMFPVVHENLRGPQSYQ
jgi:hypothetical protein